MKKIKRYFKVLKGAGEAFVDDNCVKLSASLSYYTVFAIAPMLIIIISLSSIFLGRDIIVSLGHWAKSAVDGFLIVTSLLIWRLL
jgi:membrane protein